MIHHSRKMHLRLTFVGYIFYSNATEQIIIMHYNFHQLPMATASINCLVSTQSIFHSKFLNKGIRKISIKHTHNCVLIPQHNFQEQQFQSWWIVQIPTEDFHFAYLLCPCNSIWYVLAHHFCVNTLQPDAKYF